MAFNLKIMNNGTYANFYGWTIISKIENDLKIIENFIRYNDDLHSYFSALPSSSYHITIYNLWCNKKSLLPQQQKIIDSEVCDDLKEQLEQESRCIGWFNPKNCMQKLFDTINTTCKLNKWENLILTIDKVIFNGSTIRLSVKASPEIDKMNTTRKSMINLCKKDDKLIYHMTLAYKYKNIPKKEQEKVTRQINILNMILRDQTITVLNARLHSFSSMLSFEEYNR